MNSGRLDLSKYNLQWRVLFKFSTFKELIQDAAERSAGDTPWEMRKLDLFNRDAQRSRIRHTFKVMCVDVYTAVHLSLINNASIVGDRININSLHSSAAHLQTQPDLISSKKTQKQLVYRKM